MRRPAAHLGLTNEGDIHFWTPNSFRTSDSASATPLPGLPAINVLDLRGYPPDLALVAASADLLLVDCAPAWTAICPTPCAELPAIADPADAPLDTLAALHLLLGDHPSDQTRHLAAAAASWAHANGVACGVLGAASAAGLAALAEFGPPLPLPGAVLDLRDGVDLLTVSLPLLDAMADGAPVLFHHPSPWRGDLVRAGAAIGLPNPWPDLAALPVRTISTAALAYVRDRHSPSAVEAALRHALAAARQRAEFRLAHWPERTRGLFVLVISDEALNLLDIRVHLPFGALRARGAIAGYAVLRHGHFVFSTEPVTDTLRFGAIWVQRSLDPLVELMLTALGRPFVYDLDDLLLVSPTYRAPFPAESAATCRSLIGQARVLSCATPLLAALVQAHGVEGAVAKTVVTPNLASGPAIAVAGPPRALVWASSDQPALSASRREVERAVRDFARVHGFSLLCIGAEPPPEFAAAGLQVEHVGLLSYAAYLARLRAAAPGILLAPLETGADPGAADRATQDFIAAKSDVKLVDARMAGLIGVFSRAAPYLYSELVPEILCDNTYESWLAGLERARLLCAAGRAPAPFPPSRLADGLGPLPWADALDRARTHFAVADIAAALAFVRAQGEALIGTPAAFDEDDYLRRHPDVRDAVAAGVTVSGYRHYVQFGFREGREARRLPSPDAAAAFWWSRLLHRLGRLEADIGERSRTIERLRDRTALPRPILPPPAVAEPQGDIDWVPPGSLAEACPVCDSPGPHPNLLTMMGETLARCRACRSCFYARREPYDYEAPDAAGLLLQLNLEQNAGIYHQTRPLFAIEGVGSVLDVGCGFGFAVDLAARLGWRAVGVDPSFYAEAGRTTLGADIRQTYLTTETELGDPFDLVLASEVLEHLPAPYDFLALLRRHLAPDGTLVLSTPDADAVAPASGPARLLALLAPRVHLVLFTRDSLARALQRAGFDHVRVTREGDGLLAYASARPLRFRADAEQRQAAAYRDYLEGLLDRVAPGTTLWNGAAGRLLAWRTPVADAAELDALFARIAEAWRRFDLDLAEPRLPAAPPSATATDLAALYPINLASVLHDRASFVASTPGRSPAAILAYARPAYRIAVQTGRALQAANMIDHDLRTTAQRARLRLLDALAELAPELESSLLAGLLQPSPGGLADWADPAPDTIVPRLAAAFTAAVAADQIDEARRLEPALGDADALCRALDASDEALLRTLLALGRLHLDADAEAALSIFRRMQAEARWRLHRGPAIADLLHLAEDHMTIAADRLRQPARA